MPAALSLPSPPVPCVVLPGCSTCGCKHGGWDTEIHYRARSKVAGRAAWGDGNHPSAGSTRPMAQRGGCERLIDRLID